MKNSKNSKPSSPPNTGAIGVFDSGLGGLSVLKELQRALPAYTYVYLGDNARAPYGDRSAARIYEFTQQGVRFLFERGCPLVILACNTASSEALRRLQQEWLPLHFPDRRVLGIIIPTAELIAKKYADKRVGIIGTRATIQSGAYVREIEKLGKRGHPPFSLPCPLLVPLIEEGWQDTVPGRQILKKYLRPLKIKQVDVIILGCTHYALVHTRISKIMGRRVRVIDTGAVAAASLVSYLSRHTEIEQCLSRTGSGTDLLRKTEPDPILLSTDTSLRINNLVQRTFGTGHPVEQVSLDD